MEDDQMKDDQNGIYPSQSRQNKPISYTATNPSVKTSTIHIS